MTKKPTQEKEPMRVLHILDHSLPLHSGYAFRSQSIFKAQAKRECQPMAVTSPKHQESWKEGWDGEEIINGFTHYRTALSTTRSLHGYYELRLVSALRRRILDIASQYNPDLMHAHSPVLNAMAALGAKRRLGIPLIYEIRGFWEDAAVNHGTYSENSWKYRLVRAMETRICRKSDWVMVICDGLRQELIRRGITPAKISIVPNSIDMKEFGDCEPDKELLTRCGLGKKQIIGFLGSFYRYEGLDLAVEAFASLAAKYQNWILLFAGGGEMEASLKEKTRELGLGDRVLFAGRIPHDRIPATYALCDVLVYPRYSMRLTELVTPLKPLEAMAMGKALVASDVGGHKELIIDGETGLLFPAGNASALASSIERLMTNKELRQALAKKGRDWVRKERNWDKTVTVYESVYQKLLAANRQNESQSWIRE
jgi:PEP-CTERM/exosortase A-associated glycosyltransferase